MVVIMLFFELAFVTMGLNAMGLWGFGPMQISDWELPIFGEQRLLVSRDFTLMFFLSGGGLHFMFTP